ncbi:MAG: lipopolysaccharide heptosyltransferase II [Zoogloeaceae bacterium]|jgi:heptosyltransferase-2|nr:lipopolysaccharide heptosyltransferase II [Zoogloeaceae bacterium]
MSAEERALVIAPSWIGDAIMAQPLFARLKAQNPQLRIDALAPAWVRPVLSRMAEISAVRPSPFAHGELNLMQRLRLARELKQSAYDRAYILPNSFKSALVPWLADIPRRIGFLGECRFGLINERHRLNKAALPLMVERFAQLAEPLGKLLTRPVAPPRLISSRGQQTAVLTALGLAQEGDSNAMRPVVLCPGAEYGPAKRWPARHFTALAWELVRTGHPVWLLGSSKDHPIAESIRIQVPGDCRNLCGRTRIDQAIDLIAQASLVVCNDSGLMHVAAALDRPTIALFGSSSPDFTPPLSPKATVMRTNMPCSPCFKRVCPYGHTDCLEKLLPAQVLEMCQARLN